MKDLQNIFEDDFIEEYQPERNLLAAILDRVIRDTWATERATLREVNGYLYADIVKNPRVFSFQYVCEHLDLDVIWMRAWIKTLNKENYNPS